MPISVCFVCLGNICRSPTAEGIMLALVQQRGLDGRIAVDSAGTSAMHNGELADWRSRTVAERRGVPLVSRSRRFQAKDFARFDYVLAMDNDNAAHLQRLAKNDAQRHKIHLLRNFDPATGAGLDVPDPYYDNRFDEVFDMCVASCTGLLDHLIRAHGL